MQPVHLPAEEHAGGERRSHLAYTVRGIDSNPEEESQSETHAGGEREREALRRGEAQAKLFSRALRNRAFPRCCRVRDAARRCERWERHFSVPHLVAGSGNSRPSAFLYAICSEIPALIHLQIIRASPVDYVT